MNPYQSAEWGVLSSILHDNSVLSSIDLSPEDFSTIRDREIFRAMRELHARGLPVEPGGICEALPPMRDLDRIPEYLQLVMDDSVSTMPHEYASALKKRRAKSRAKQIGKELAEAGDVDAAIAGLYSLSYSDRRWSHDPSTLVDDAIRSLDQPSRGIITGFDRFDARFGGLHPGDLYVLGARPAVGKTALMLNLVTRCGVPAMIFSGEQSAVQCQIRMLSSIASVPLERLRTHQLTDQDWSKLERGREALRSMRYWIFDKPAPTLGDIGREARRVHAEHGLKVVFVDYLQRMHGDPSKTMHEQVSVNVQGLKELARDLDVPVVVLAQVNRRVDSREDKMPTMADLKDSGTIEQEADVIVLMYRERAYRTTSESRAAELYVAKNRHGPTGSIDLVYVEEYVRFENVETRY